MSSLSSQLLVGNDGGMGVEHQPCDVALGATQCKQQWAFDPAQCSISGSTTSEAIYGWEQQYIYRRLTLFFHGDRAEGTLAYTKTWCGDYSGVKYRATAVRSTGAEPEPPQ